MEVGVNFTTYDVCVCVCKITLHLRSSYLKCLKTMFSLHNRWPYTPKISACGGLNFPKSVPVFIMCVFILFWILMFQLACKCKPDFGIRAPLTVPSTHNIYIFRLMLQWIPVTIRILLFGMYEFQEGCCGLITVRRSSPVPAGDIFTNRYSKQLKVTAPPYN